MFGCTRWPNRGTAASKCKITYTCTTVERGKLFSNFMSTHLYIQYAVIHYQKKGTKAVTGVELFQNVLIFTLFTAKRCIIVL